jgi:hypothetical protein
MAVMPSMASADWRGERRGSGVSGGVDVLLAGMPPFAGFVGFYLFAAAPGSGASGSSGS